MFERAAVGRAVVSVASWEPRWRASVRALWRENKGAKLHVLHSAKYDDWTREARAEILTEARSAEIETTERELDLERPGSTWHDVVAFTTDLLAADVRSVALDGTTMPRELTWVLLHAFGEVDYAYVPVGSYGAWQSKESLQLRLVLKRSGILFPDKPTCVVAMSGFDLGRLDQLIS